MKIIHTGDWHLGKLLNGYPLIEDQRRWMTAFLRELEQDRPDVLLIAGDVFDRGVPPAPAITLLGDALHALRELEIAVLIISGNHDAGERLEFARQLLWDSGVYIAGSLRPVESDESASLPAERRDCSATSLPPGIQKVTLTDSHGPVHFYLLPHSDRHLLRRFCGGEPTDSFSDLLHAYCKPMLDSLDTTARNVLMAHGFFALGSHDLEYNGVSVGGSEKIDLTPFTAFDYIALGHLHSVKGTGLPQAQYAGSPMKFSIGEASQEKYYLRLALEEKGSLSQTLCKSPCPRDLKILKGTFEELQYQGEQRGEPLEDYLFLHLTDSMPVTDVVMRLKPYYPYLLGVSFPNIMELTPLATEMTADTLPAPQALFASFYEKSTQSALTPLQEALIHSAIDTTIPKTVEQ